jgi:hypothetical protein
MALLWIAFTSTALAVGALVACAVLSLALIEERRAWFDEGRAMELLKEVLDQIEADARREPSWADLRELAARCEFVRNAALHTTAVDQESINALQLVQQAASCLSEAKKSNTSPQRAQLALQEFRHSAAYCRQVLSNLRPARDSFEGKGYYPKNRRWATCPTSRLDEEITLRGGSAHHSDLMCR